MRMIVKQVITILFMVFIFEKASYGQNTNTSSNQLNLNYEELMKDIPKPLPSFCTIFILHHRIAIRRWSRSMKLCVYGKHLIDSDLPLDPYHNDMFKSTVVFDESVIKKSQRRCKVCKNKMCIVHYRNYDDEKHTLMRGGSFRLCPYCGEKESVLFVN